MLAKRLSRAGSSEYFEDVRKAGFQQRYSGMFRIAEGPPPFHRRLRYEGPTAFSEVRGCAGETGQRGGA